MDNSKIRLHIPAIPYTITRDEYSHDAFTGKVKRFSPMMRSLGFEVFHYGVETSESGATKDINLFTKEEWTELRIKTFQVLDNITWEEAVKKNNDETIIINKLSNWKSPLSVEFNKRFREKLIENYRGTKTDIVCIPLARTYQEAIDKLNLVLIEFGIGYVGSYLNYRIFEAQAWLSRTLGAEDKPPNNYWFVVPHGFDINEFKYSCNPNQLKVGYMGRIVDLKGCDIIKEVAKRFPHVEFVMCGQGNPAPFLDSAVPNLKYKSPIHGKQRSEFLGDCVAFIHPVKYLEPFGCGPVEAQLCGTPVICSDWGGMGETIEQYKTGLRCHTLADYCHGIQMALDGKFNRKYIRERSANLYDMYKLAYNYEYIFKSVLDIYNPTKNGWYSPDRHIAKLVNKKLETVKESQRIYLLLPYYGQFPNYFQLYLDSLEINKDILTVILISNNNLSNYKVPDNLIQINLTVEDIKNRISNVIYKIYGKHVSNKDIIPDLYKIVDFKIMYPLLFNDHIEKLGIKEQDFVGWGDCDVIYGKLSNFINFEEDYGIIGGWHGHFTAFKNNNGFKNSFTLIPNLVDLLLDNSRAYGTDEIAYREPLKKYVETNNIKMFYMNRYFCDIVPPKFFYLFRPNYKERGKNFFDVTTANKNINHLHYDKVNSRLIVTYDDGSSRETTYAHLQKRKMDLRFSSYDTGYYINEDSFYLKDQIIPSKVWTMWHDKTLPPKLKECVEELKQQNPDFEHNVFNDIQCQEFIKEHFPKEVLIAYNSLIPIAYKADLWRLCVLYVHGGIYVDIKLKFLNGIKLDSFIDKEHLVSDGTFQFKGTTYNSICNGLISVKKNNKFLLNCIANIVYNVANKHYGETPWQSTGPQMMGINYGKLLDPSSYVHTGTWSMQYITTSDGEKICAQYPEYRNEQKEISSNGLPGVFYKELWNQKNIYLDCNIDIQTIYKDKLWPEELHDSLGIILNRTT